MKQLVQNLSNGLTEVKEVPSPQLKEGTVLIKTQRSLISSGTERMLVDFAKSNYLQKALKQPDKVKDVLSKFKTDGFKPTLEAVTSKLNEPMPLGYCNAGEVIESGVPEFKVGDRVVSNGFHAEIVRVGRNLCAKIPEEVDYDSAAFTVLGAVALQGVRLINPTIGEKFVVFGLGTVGLMTVQILLANGCQVLAVDLDIERSKLAQKFGAQIVDVEKGEDLLSISKQFSNGLGCDGVIISASSESDQIIHEAAEVCRKRGRVVLVGVVGMNLKREDFYEKEITLQVSSSYGPGRYDPQYEEEGIDYPIGFVRWTENRNFEAILQLMSSGLIDVHSLITSKYDLEQANLAYDKLSEKNEVGILLNYPESEYERKSIFEIKKNFSSQEGPVIGLVGAGNYSSRVLIPAFNKLNLNKHTIVSSLGLSASENANKSSFSFASSSIEDILSNDEINTVFIATRHNLHAEQVIRCLESKKNVYVEKPLAIGLSELEEIKEAYDSINPKEDENIKLMVGFNRRFSPHIQKIKLITDSFPGPLSTIITVNAGHLDNNHWTNNLSEGGGRILGEACHFIDLMTFINNSPVISFSSQVFGKNKEFPAQTASITLEMENGSFGTVHYFSNGGKSFPKERIEVFHDSSTIVLDNFRSTRGYNIPGFRKFKTFSQDKGHLVCINSFIESISKGTESPISFRELYHSSLIAIEVSNEINSKLS